MMYRFTKNGKTYSANGENIFSAKVNAETRWGVDLTGAKFEEIWKNKVIRTGTAR